MNFQLKGLSYALLCMTAFAAAARAATVTGTLTDDSGKPLAGAQATIPALKKGAVTDSQGKFSIEDVPAGGYAIQFRKADYGVQSEQVRVPETGASVAAVLKQNPIEMAPITITAAPAPTTTFNAPSSVSVVQGRALQRASGESVMSAIQNVPGVNMVDEGPTVVKPVINGLSSQDLVVVRDGVREEFIQWGNEHAPEIPSDAGDIIEVLRGPNSLLYGSDALGGVISIRQPDLPSADLGAGPLSGTLGANVHTVNNSVGQTAMLQGAQGDWGWRANLEQQTAGNFATPNEGVIPNTGEHEASGDGTLELRKDWGNVTANYSHFDKYVELQNGVQFPNPTSTVDDEFQNLIHDHAMLRANVATPLARLELTGGYDRANRMEFNNNDDPYNPASEMGAHWIETSYTADAKAHLEPMGPFQGTLGFSGTRRVEEQLLPATHLTPGYNLNGTGEYLYEEATFGDFTVSGGLRADQNHYSIDGDPLVGAGQVEAARPVASQTLNYGAVTGALGGVYHITDPLAFAVNVGRGYRNPDPFELFADGVHEGAGVFQIGNPGLTPEISLNTNAELRWQSDALKATAGVFRNYIHNYIYGTYSGAAGLGGCQTGFAPDENGNCIPVVNETQSNATIQGVDFTAGGAATDWLTLTAVGNLVRGYNDSGDPTLNGNVWIPHVPADNLKVGAEAHRKSLGVLLNPYFGADWKGTAAQRRASPNEISTPGYGLVGVHAGGEFAVLGNRTTVDVGVDNLLNQGYIDYNSILKEFGIENPGRDIYFKLSVPFGS
ncbi:MAG TPA: TonB-dependent receptor [Elusimicrobiota bacterium]|jgi:iron complex outermembrane receptor protein|nr:TonB-dependent receptor [Elusimicrobiota bacterium]